MTVTIQPSRSSIDALGGLALRCLGVGQGLLLTVFLLPDQRGRVALVMSSMIVVAQLAPLGADHALAVSSRRPPWRQVATPARAASFTVALVVFLSLTTGRSWSTGDHTLTLLWAVAAVATPVGAVVVADIQRQRRQGYRILAQACPLAIGAGGLLLLAGGDRLTPRSALTVLGLAAVVALPVRLGVWAAVPRAPSPANSTAGSHDLSPTAGFAQSAMAYLAVHIPTMSIQRADQIILATFSTMDEAGLYALVAAVAFLQTAVTEQILKREVADRSAESARAWRWAIISYLVALVATVAATTVLSAYRAALLPGLLLCTGWFAHFGAYRIQLLASGSERSRTPTLVAAAHLALSLPLSARFGATGAATAFLIVNGVWLASVAPWNSGPTPRQPATAEREPGRRG